MNYKKSLFAFAALVVSLASCGDETAKISSIPTDGFTVNGEKPRVVVMTDGEIDDHCSMVHFLLCSNEFEVDAIIQTNSIFQRQGWSSIHWIEKQLDDYEAVYPNLKVHSADFPTPDYLRSVLFLGDEDSTHLGQARVPYVPGRETEETLDPTPWPKTPGSDKIVDLLLEDDPRTVFIQAWGGGNTAAKAFQVLKDEHPADYERAVKKAVLYNIWYQDGGGQYIEKFHPDVTMLNCNSFAGTWNYNSQRYTRGFAEELLHKDHGPLAANYVQGDISEGDSPSFFYNMDNGLRSYEHPTYGGWGGRFRKVEGLKNVWIDTGKGSYSRWIEYVNRDFEARLNWCVTPKYEDASHRPDIEIVSGLEITVASGDTVVIEAIVLFGTRYRRYDPMVAVKPAPMAAMWTFTRPSIPESRTPGIR